MNYLLDTHYLIWSLFEPKKIPAKIRQILQNDTDTKLVSGVSLWEISLKYSLGKLELSGTNPDELLDIVTQSGFDLIELDNRLLATYFQLPKKDNHKDPFDRLLIWQAITNDYTLITQDKKIGRYVSDGLQLV